VRDVSVVATSAADGTTGDERSVLATLAPDEPSHIEDVIVRCGLAPGQVGAALMALELAGRARQIEGQRWIAVGPRSRRG
jgi:predicted Rossmann fold nucleotide-binding protein DprA/Smf involved in DNA uptake